MKSNRPFAFFFFFQYGQRLNRPARTSHLPCRCSQAHCTVFLLGKYVLTRHIQDKSGLQELPLGNKKKNWLYQKPRRIPFHLEFPLGVIPVRAYVSSTVLYCLMLNIYFIVSLYGKNCKYLHMILCMIYQEENIFKNKVCLSLLFSPLFCFARVSRYYYIVDIIMLLMGEIKTWYILSTLSNIINILVFHTTKNKKTVR